MGKNLLINSLLNSQFCFNAQIENPPVEFVREIELKNKKFLWNDGVPKIAHHSLMGDYNVGGIRYKDIPAFLRSINMKFLLRLAHRLDLNNTCIPKYWLIAAL